jgi:putative SOS response-associated peptidase YedK
MPLILRQDQESAWLNPLTPLETIQDMLASNNQTPLRCQEVTVPLQQLDLDQAKSKNT